MIISEQDIISAIKQMPPPAEAAHIVTPSKIKQRVIDSFHSNDDEFVGLPIQFNSAATKVRFRTGEVTVLSGENHTGKSEILNQFMLHHVGSSKSFIMSPEMPVFRTVHNMTRQALAKGLPSEAEISDFVDAINDKIYLLDQQTTFTPEMVLNLIRYVKDVYSIDFVVIDSLMKCGINENDDHGKIKWFIDQLCVTAKTLGVHIFIVAHNKKPAQGQRPSRYDTKGSGAISDLADNSIIIWRNWAKEEALMKNLPAEEKLEWEQEPDSKLIVDKQRTTGHRAVIELWHWLDERVFLDSKQAHPIPINIGGINA